MSLKSHHLRTLRALVFRAQKEPKEINITIRVTRKNVILRCFVQAKVPLFKMTIIWKQSDKSIINNFLTISSSLKLEHTHIMLFSSKLDILLTIYVPSVLICLKCFSIHGLKIWSTTLASKIPRCSPTGRYFLVIHEGRNVSDLFALLSGFYMKVKDSN